MKVEYDSHRDLLYVYFSMPSKKVVKTVTIVPGVFADFDKNGRLIGLEVLDASEVIDKKIEFDLSKMEQVA